MISDVWILIQNVGNYDIRGLDFIYLWKKKIHLTGERHMQKPKTNQISGLFLVFEAMEVFFIYKFLF